MKSETKVSEILSDEAVNFSYHFLTLYTCANGLNQKNC